MDAPKQALSLLAFGTAEEVVANLRSSHGAESGGPPIPDIALGSSPIVPESGPNLR